MNFCNTSNELKTFVRGEIVNGENQSKTVPFFLRTLTPKND